MDAHRLLDLVLTSAIVAMWVAWLYASLTRTPAPPPAVPAQRSTVRGVTLRLMCQDESQEHARVQIPAASRRPTYVHEGQHYVASRKVNGDWIYRWMRKD